MIYTKKQKKKTLKWEILTLKKKQKTKKKPLKIPFFFIFYSIYTTIQLLKIYIIKLINFIY